MKMQRRLPAFKKPPLVETAISVQFKTLAGFKNAHLGIFWQSIRSEFPKIADAAPIEEQTEPFGDQAARRVRLPSFRVVAGDAVTRLQMSSENGSAMLQLQNGRLVFNWRRIENGEYPRWHTVLAGFKKGLEQLKTMLASQNLPELSPNQWEVTYVNQLAKGRDWNNQLDWPKLVPGVIGTLGAISTGKVETATCNMAVLLPNNQGRLHVNLVHGFTGPEPNAPEVAVLQFTARGGIDPQTSEQALVGVEIGHAAIVQTFCDVTGSEAHLRWEREQ